MIKYDLIVIGSGPAGFTAAMRALDYAKKVCIVEKDEIGGAGVINGALTSKTMWELSQDYAVAASVDRGFRASGLTVDYNSLRKTIIKTAKTKQLQILSQIETFSKQKEGEGFLHLKYGHAKFIDKHTIEISKDNKTEILQADNFVIATGSKPKDYPGLDVDQKRIINSDGILNLTEFPERMIIIGSGIIGTEFATIFSNFKQTEVHLLDRSHRVIPFEDDDVSDFVSKNLEKNGVIIHHTANLRTINKHDDFLEVVLDYQDGHSKVLEVDVALISIGRVPNTENLGLENLNISTTERGFLKISNDCHIKNCPADENIFAAGDITGYAQLVNVAEMQGRYASKTAFNTATFPLSYANMSTLMFFKPEVAAVGANEKILQQNGIPYRAAYYSNELVSRALAMRNFNGFVKIIISADGTEKILGMRAAGPQASAFIVSIAHLINQGDSLAEVMRVVHPHPSVTEGIQECLRVLKGKSVYKPEAFPDLIRVWEWKP
ncbi:MAG: NAD(P)/FAD-dependent oxidoreductase [Bacteroidales bacterium]|nr:NAD(P)/FAD-dependent oxidoreductase [Bacteroidales bacterium]MBN2757012.1 NAD(P)/FAD-dependent oxidoreductase [Bacteroidales bacterium]